MSDTQMPAAGRFRSDSLIIAGGLLAASLLVFALVELLEGGSARLLTDPLGYLQSVDPAVAADRVAGAAEVVAGVLAILITVVAIVVELAANRYTHRITQLFIREPVNALVVGLFSLTTILCLWLSTLPPPDVAARGALPGAPLLVCMALVTLCLLSLIPYLSFLFHFISPIRIIGRIRRQAELALEPRRRGAIDQARAQVIEAIEELEDIASGSPDGADRAISMASVDALAELVEHYASKKAELPPDWFAISGGLASDPDFVAMDASALGGIEAQGTWLEVKVLRQYLALLSGSLGRPRGVATLVTLNTRRLAESRAIPVDLSIRFFNSYLRASITGRDARTGYYALSQYRMLAESLMSAGDTEATIEIAGHLRYYGRLGYEVSQPFLLEVVAYDVALLVEQAASEDAVAVDTLLDLLLEIDAETGRSEHEAPIRGVRRAQIQLATFFLERGDDEDRARRIFDDMKHDPTERLELIRNELLTETDPQYREFTDRGVNFAYLAPSRHDALERFFGWLNAEA